jgi:uncharacterized cupredoxin-like copper-binding protein
VLDLEVTLEPGRYVLTWNADGHYTGGMHTAFKVSE